MFDWIPFLAGILILTWAFFAGAIALRGGAHAGLHETAPPAPETAVEASTVSSSKRIVPFAVVQALQFALAGAVTLAGLWLVVQIVD